MAEETEIRRVSSHPASTLYHARSALLDRLSQLGASIKSVNAP
jgi:hypothetical protein